MPEEILALLIVLSFLTFIFTIIKTTQQYKLKKMEHDSVGSGDSLTTSELERMIEEAVGDATKPLRDQIDDLGARLHLVESRSESRLELEDVDVRSAAPAAEKTVGRQARPERA